MEGYVASEIVEEYAIKIYREFDKLTNENEPSAFTDIITIISEILENFDKNIIENRSLKSCLQLIENEKEELLLEIQRVRECGQQKTEKLLLLQDEVDLLKLDQSVNIWERDVLKLTKEKAQLEAELLAEKAKVKLIQDEKKTIEEKVQELEHIYAELVLDHRNLTLAVKLLKEDQESSLIKTQKNQSDKYEQPFTEVVRKHKHLKTKYNPLSKQCKLVSNSDISIQPQKTCQYNNKKIRVNRTNTSQVTLISDSQGRDIALYLDKHMSETQNIFGHVMPGANFNAITNFTGSYVEIKEYNKEDYIIWIGGTNDAAVNFQNLPRMKFMDLLKQEAMKYKHTNLIVATIPYRYDLAEASFENDNIRKINHDIRALSYKFSHIHLLDLHLLTRRHHTRHGLHINRRGKRHVASEIVKIIQKTKVKSHSNKTVTALSTPYYSSPNPADAACLVTSPAAIQETLRVLQVGTRSLSAEVMLHNVDLIEQTTQEHQIAKHLTQGQTVVEYPTTLESPTDVEDLMIIEKPRTTHETATAGQTSGSLTKRSSLPITTEESNSPPKLNSITYSEDEQITMENTPATTRHTPPDSDGTKSSHEQHLRTPDSASLEGSPSKGFVTPERKNIKLLQSLIDKYMEDGEDLNLKNKNNYFLRRGKRKQREV